MAIISKYLFAGTFQDSVGTVHGTANGGMDASATDGDRTVAVFDGTDDYIDLGSDFRFNTEDFTFSMWIKPQSSQQDWARIMGTLYNDPIRGWGFEQEAGQTNRYRFQSFDGSTWTESDANNVLEITPDVWSHLVITRSGTAIKGYINGQHVYTAVTHATMDSTHNFQLGTNPAVSQNNWGDYWAGSIDEFTVHDVALSDGEVETLYDNDPLTPVTVSLTFEMVDSYGDGWNGSTFQIYDDANVTVQSLTLAGGAGPEVVSFELPEGDYTWAFVSQNWMSEVTATLTNTTADPDEQILFSSGGNLLSGAFTLSLPFPSISPTLETSAGDITISVTLNDLAVSAGATGWAYSLTDIFVDGQAHGGTAVALGADATVSPTPHGEHAVYVAAIDTNGLVVVKNQASINNTPPIEVTIVKSDSYNDSWDGTVLEIRNAGDNALAHSSTLASGASPETIYVDLTPGDYTWALVGGGYPEEHSVDITRSSDGLALASSAASVPSNGSFTLAAPGPSISVDSTTQLNGEVTMAVSANALAIAEGATHWAHQDATPFVLGATHSGATSLLAATSTETYASAGVETIHVAALDGAGTVLAISSVDVDIWLPKVAIDDEFILTTYLDHPSIPGTGAHPLLDEDNEQWGPFWIGELTVKSLSVDSQDESTIEQAVTFDDGSGGTLDLDWLIKQLIIKNKLHELSGPHATAGAVFKSIIDGTAAFDAADLLSWNAEDTHTILTPASPSGWSADYDLQLFSDSGTTTLIEYASGTGTVSGPNGAGNVAYLFAADFEVAADPTAQHPRGAADAQYDLSSDGADSVGSNDGTLFGDPQFGLEDGRGFITLDGTGDYVRVPHDASNNFGDPSQNFTISFWFKTDADYSILSKGRPSSASDFWGFYIDAGRIVFRAWDQGPDAAYTATSETDTFTDNLWHHVVVSHDSGTAYLYVDGNCEASVELTQNHSNSDYLTIGAYFNYSWGDNYFTGDISDVRLWTSESSWLNVTTMYQEGVPSSLGASTSVSGDDVTISVSPNLNAIADGIVAWAYSVDTPLGAVGNPHGGTAAVLGNSEVVTVAVGQHDIYAAGIDASGNVVLPQSQVSIDTTPMVTLRFDWYADHWSGFNSRTFELLDSGDNIVHSVSPASAGAGTENITIPQDTYKWQVVAYRNDYKDIENHAQATFQVWQIDIDEYGSDFLLLEKGSDLDGNPGPFVAQANNGGYGNIMQGPHNIVLPRPPEHENLTVPVWEAGKTYQWANWQSEQNVTDYGGYVDFSLSVDIDDLPFAPGGLPSAGAITLVVDGIDISGAPFADRTLIYTYTGLDNPGSLYDGATLQTINGNAASPLEENFWRIHQLSNYDFDGSDNVTDNVIISLQPGFPNIATPNPARPMPGLLQPGSNLVIKALLITSAGVDYDVLANIKYSSSLTSQAVDVVSHSLSLSGATMAAGFAQGDIELYDDTDQLIATYGDTATAGEAFAYAVKLTEGIYYLKMKDNENDGMFTLENNLATVVFQGTNLATGLSDEKSVIPTVAEFLANPETHDGTSDDNAHARLYFEIGADLSVAIPYTQGDTVYYTNAGLTPEGWTGQVYDDSTGSNIVESWYTWPTGAGFPSAGVGTLIDNGQGGGNNNNNNNNNQGGENNMARIIKNRVDLRTQMEDGEHEGPFGTVGAEFLKGDGRAIVDFVMDNDHHIINKGLVKGSYDALIADVAAEESSYDVQKATDDATEVTEEGEVAAELAVLEALMAEGISWKSPELTVDDAFARAIADRDAGNPWLNGSVVAIHTDLLVLLVLKESDLEAQICTQAGAVNAAEIAADITSGALAPTDVVPFLVGITSMEPDRLFDFSSLELAVQNLMDVDDQFTGLMGFDPEAMSVQDQCDAARAHAIAAYTTAVGQTEQMAQASSNFITALLAEDKDSDLSYTGTYAAASDLTASLLGPNAGSRQLKDVEVYVAGVRSFDSFAIDAVAGTVTILAGVHEDGAPIQIFARMELITERANPLGA